ncbi:MAG: hypothetical protein ACI83O_000276 [Patescibacteria group bacterium]|jgi:uncharacterized protein (DUF58 family)
MKSTLKQIRKLEITTKKLIDGLISGNYHSIFKGNGIDFSELQEYKAGDDIRNIDWNVTARLHTPYVKQFIEERDLSVYFIVDISSSSAFGNQISKMQKILEITASLAYSAVKNSDKVGLFLTTEDVEKYIPARKGKKHFLKVLDQIISFKPQSKKTDLNKSLSHVSKIIKRRGIVFIISDFVSNDFTKPLKMIKQNQDVIAIKINDQNELHLPNVGLIQLEDPETDEQIVVNTSDHEFRERYHNAIHNFNQELQTKFKKYKIDNIELNTEQSYEKPLKKFFNFRKRRQTR